jgi:TRAP-type C4-dicarboxylate transport system permease small subunit
LCVAAAPPRSDGRGFRPKGGAAPTEERGTMMSASMMPAVARPRLPLRGELLPAAPPAPRGLAMFGALVDWVVVAIGAVMIVLVFVNVLLHVVGKDLAAVTETAELLMVWVTFLSGGAASRRGAQMSITEFVDKLGPRARLRADAAIDLLTVFILVLLMWYGASLVVTGWGNELTVLQIPMSFQYLGMPVGCFAMLVWVVYDLVLISRGKTRDQRFPKG